MAKANKARIIFIQSCEDCPYLHEEICKKGDFLIKSKKKVSKKCPLEEIEIEIE